MANKDAIINNFYANEAVAAQTIKKGKYRVFNGQDYDIVHLQTSADQVLETNDRKFVSQNEKDAWNRKADRVHDHNDAYNTKSEITEFLLSKAEKRHTHDPSSINQDANHRFISDTQKDRWNNTYTVEEVNNKVTDINSAIETLTNNNTSEHSNIIKGYQAAVNQVNSKVTTVEEEVATLSTSKADKTQVATDIETAKSSLQTIIKTKANASDVTNQLKLKANVDNVYTKKDVEDKLSTKAETSYVTEELKKKVSTTTFTSSLATKANKNDMENALSEKASIQLLETELEKKAEASHTHVHSQITGLGTAATKYVGTEKGQIPILGEEGKLDSSVLPAIAINQTFTANDQTEAMQKDMQIGDILILTTVARDVAIEKQKQGKAITYTVAKSKSYQKLSDEYINYLSSGRMTYLCVDDQATLFEDKFKPLQSSGDTISKAEVDSKLASKVSNTTFNDYQREVSNNLELKADKLTTYTKIEVDKELNKKVNVEQGKQLSTHDFTDELKTKLDNIDERANHYVHPNNDGDLHVPATRNDSNGKVLMAETGPKAFSWTTLTTAHVLESTGKKYVTEEQISTWDAKANANHKHDEYRLASESFNKVQTSAEISKMRTIVDTNQPASGTHMIGAVWIEEITS